MPDIDFKPLVGFHNKVMDYQIFAVYAINRISANRSKSALLGIGSHHVVEKFVKLLTDAGCTSELKVDFFPFINEVESSKYAPYHLVNKGSMVYPKISYTLATKDRDLKVRAIEKSLKQLHSILSILTTEETCNVNKAISILEEQLSCIKSAPLLLSIPGLLINSTDTEIPNLIEIKNKEGKYYEFI